MFYQSEKEVIHLSDYLLFIVVVVGLVEKWKVAGLEAKGATGWVGNVGDHNLWSVGRGFYQTEVWIKLWIKVKERVS